MRSCFSPFLLLSAIVLSSSPDPLAGEPNRPFWDFFPRIVETHRLETALEHHATIGLNGTQTDPGWGLYAQRNGSRPERLSAFQQAGIKSLSYFETFGQSYCYVSELPPEKRGDYYPLRAGFWSWWRYSGGPILWMGVHQYFEDLPACRPYTRTHPRYGSPPATYPDGTVASGYIGTATDPRNSRVFDAICSKDILGHLAYETRYNERVNQIDPETGKPAGPTDGLVYIPETGEYTGLFLFNKDSACPAWIDYAYASTLMAADQGLDGTWTDNFGPWDSFGHQPVLMAFGDWSVARFRNHLKTAFPPERLQAMGIENLETFDIRESLMATAKEWGWDGKNLQSPTWRDPRWLEEPLWRAYLIFKRKAGTDALERYYRALKTAARKAGKDEFLVAGNDIPGFSLGWPRGELDMVSTEVTAGWGNASGARGFGLPPYGRFAPFYKLGREHAKGRFVNIWFYHDHFEKELSDQWRVSTLYYEMLANHALPMFHPRLERVIGSPETNAKFFEFVSRVAPLYGDREPIEEIGLFYSSSSVLAQFTPGGFKNLNDQPHQFAFWGWATALGELHVQYRPIPEWKLNEETLKPLRALIIPDAEVLDPSVVEKVLLPWVRDHGGRVLLTANTGQRLGEAGNFDRNPDGSSILPLIGLSDLKKASDERLNVLGSGKVLYLKPRVGLDFYMAENQEHRIETLPRFRGYLSTLLEDRHPLALQVLEGETPQVGITLYQSPAAEKVFLDLNHYGIDSTSNSLAKTLPLTVSIQLPEFLRGAPLQASVVAPDSTPEASITLIDNGRLEMEIDPIHLYAGVILSASR